MAKRSAPKKRATHRKASEKFSFDQLLTKKHRPLHVAGLGAIMVFLQGLIAVVGVVLIIGAAVAYAMRAMKTSR